LVSTRGSLLQLLGTSNLSFASAGPVTHIVKVCRDEKLVKGQTWRAPSALEFTGEPSLHLRIDWAAYRSHGQIALKPLLMAEDLVSMYTVRQDQIVRDSSNNLYLEALYKSKPSMLLYWGSFSARHVKNIEPMAVAYRTIFQMQRQNSCPSADGI
jgi:hypothetical protein